MRDVFILRSLAAAALVSLSSLAQAAPTQWTTGQIVVDFDPDLFAFSRDGEDVPASSVGYLPNGNGLTLDFNGLMSLLASSYTYYSPETRYGTFNAAFGITPQPGYAITGYTLTYAGDYSIETPGSVSMWGPGAGLPTQSGGFGSFSQSGDVLGAALPTLMGGLDATGSINVIQVFDGYQQVLDHYEQVLDYCEPLDPSICYYREEPVYIDVPLYHDETDLGEASINLQTIQVQAHVVPVPEPDALILVLGGALPFIAWRMKQRRRDASA